MTALFGILFLILLSTSKYAFLVLAITMGKIYGITVLANLTLIQGMRSRLPGSQGFRTSAGFFQFRVHSGIGTNTSLLSSAGLQLHSLRANSGIGTNTTEIQPPPERTTQAEALDLS